MLGWVFTLPQGDLWAGESGLESGLALGHAEAGQRGQDVLWLT